MALINLPIPTPWKIPYYTRPLEEHMLQRILAW